MDVNCQIYAPAAFSAGEGLLVYLLNWRLGQPQNPSWHVIHLLVVALLIKFTAFLEYLFYFINILFLMYWLRSETRPLR
jgi:hypothetical protein